MEQNKKEELASRINNLVVDTSSEMVNILWTEMAQEPDLNDEDYEMMERIMSTARQLHSLHVYLYTEVLGLEFK